MANKITNRQLFFIITMTLITITLSSIPKVIVSEAEEGGWFTVIIASIIFAFFSLIIISLNKMFVGKVLFEYSQELVGNSITYIISIFYIFYFAAILIYMNISLSNVLKTNFLFETPHWAIFFASLIVCGYGAYKGITNVARLLEIYGIIFIISVILIHTFMLLQGEMDYIRPLFITSETPKYFSALKGAIFPFLGIEVLTVIPLSNENKKVRRLGFLTIIFVGIIYAYAIETSVMMIGINEIIHYQDATLTSIRLIQLPKIEFLKRLDAVYLTVGLMGIHAAIIVIYMVIVEFLTKIFLKLKRLFIVIGVGLLILLISILVLRIKDFLEIFGQSIIFFGIVALVLIPSILLIIALVKKYEKRIL